MELVTEGATANNLAKVIKEATTWKGKLGKDEILIELKLFGKGMYMFSFPTKKIIILSVLHLMNWFQHFPNGVSVFQGAQNGIIQQLKKN